jgi:hypothetical protein
MIAISKTTTPLRQDADERPVWRYVDFVKFVDLLQTSELHFTRLDHLQDPFEHSLSRAAVQRDKRKFGPRVEYVNCWFESRSESAAMWSIYAQNGGIAVRSNFDRLQKVMEALPKRLYGFDVNEWGFGRIRYLDEGEIATQLRDPKRRDDLTFVKRSSFSHEQENRLIVGVRCSMKESPTCLRLKVDLEAVIQSVHVSPIAPKWVADIVRREVHKYGLRTEVAHSTLYSPKLT